MSQGISGSYAINGSDLTLQPTSGKWDQRPSYGIDGSGHDIYPRTREFELQWDLISPSDLAQIINDYNSVSNTGSVVCDLPQYGASQYQFLSYSGCILQEPSFDVFFQGYTQTVKLLIRNITTN